MIRRALLSLSLASVVLMLASGAATAAGPEQAATSVVKVCDRFVCESVTGSGLLVQSVVASTVAPGPACGSFTLTITPPTGVPTVKTSPVSCLRAHSFSVNASYPALTTVCVTHSAASGRPCVRLPL